MIVKLLTKEDFYNLIAENFPISFKKFSDYIDDFKASTNWNELFKIDYINNQSPVEYDIKFHDIPFALQKGVIENFFVLNDIQYYPVKHPFSPEKWTFHTIDTIKGAIWSQFTNSTHQDLFEYDTYEDAEIGAIQMAFQILNDNIKVNLN